MRTVRGPCPNRDGISIRLHRNHARSTYAWTVCVMCMITCNLHYATQCALCPLWSHSTLKGFICYASDLLDHRPVAVEVHVRSTCVLVQLLWHLSVCLEKFEKRANQHTVKRHNHPNLTTPLAVRSPFSGQVHYWLQSTFQWPRILPKSHHLEGGGLG